MKFCFLYLFLLTSDAKTTKKEFGDVMGKLWIGIIIVILLGFVGLYIGFLTRPVSRSGQSSSPTNSSSPALIELSTTSSQLLGDRIFWTRMYLIDVMSNNGFADADLSRLMNNQEDIGNVIKPYYGEKASNIVTNFLKKDISDMVTFVDATKVQDTRAQAKANNDWHTNANQTTDFLARENTNFSVTDMHFMVKSYLDMTQQEIKDIVGKKYDASISDFDIMRNNMTQVADALASGIRQQFPERF